MTTSPTMKVLPLDNVDSFVTPENNNAATLDNSALDVFTDFRIQRPLILESGTSVDEALSLMKKSHVHVKLIVDHDEHFLGLASMAMLEGERALKLMTEMRVTRDVLTVKDIMEPRSKLHALSFTEIQTKTVGDIVETLKDIGDHHILVLDEDSNKICGMVAASDIAKLLHAPVEISPRAASFVEVVKNLSH